MRLLHAADIHLGVTKVVGERLADFEATLARMAADAEENDVAAILIAGDLCDKRYVGPDVLRAIARFIDRTKGIQKVIVPGNHDGMTTIGDPETHALLWLQGLNLNEVDVLTEPGLAGIGTRAGNLHVFALPYPHKRGLDTELADVPVDERATIVGQRVEDAIRLLLEGDRRSQALERGEPVVFLGHLTVIGSKLGSEQLMKMGWDAAIDPAVLSTFDYSALGHIHRMQPVNRKVWYAGSPEYLDFGDVGTEKGWLLVEVEPGGEPVVKPMRSGARPMIDVTATQDANGDLLLSGGGATSDMWSRGPMVRLTVNAIHERPKPEIISNAQKYMREMGATFIKTEVRYTAETLVREGATEVDPEADTADLLAGWLTQRGLPLEPTMSVGRALLASVDDAR